ncbi:DUF1257 domain-containing protein [Sodalinema gerasimenkoae]|uniref:DUF1257 domain-containing protein n=1 Tax=Sodalinema gerasimenkoae TaxID=2862348 RepID=UPI00135BFBB3|nr:DUF1257 domain-containing protein [Sodalinema gerasimenkoae]MCC5899369.1 DUF1257 domain-containing protein [Phormidium sp. BM_Day4_Bin.17]TVR05284.1 MAG: DUF1257 domain-containing protein [Phormidium sp. GEM2.Bin31]UCJ13555.1 MAG: DUF1257 domain-containing protein [Phormidium sp. PBR-2020]
MSHFSHIKTQIRDLNALQQALTELKIDWKAGPKDVRGYRGQVHQAAVVVEQDNGYDIGFSWNGQAYDLVADLQFWNQAIPVERFLSKITQQYAFATVMQETAKQGFQVSEHQTQTDGSIRLVLQRWS